MKKWTICDMPDLTNKIFIVTGANSGLGYEISKALAGKNAEVIMACRNIQAGKEAKQNIQAHYSAATITVWKLDLASLESIESFSEKIRTKYNRIHGLINNAGVMAVPKNTTHDGFEMQIGTNHIGHFMLTSRLFTLLRSTEDSRVVTVSSIASHNGVINFEDLNSENSYHRWKAYQQSKLANLMFGLEMHEKLSISNFKTNSYIAHPGVSNTRLFHNMKPNAFLKLLGNILMPFITQSAKKGALPILYAATCPDAEPGVFYGPHGRREHKGYPAEAFVPEQAKIQEDREKLWKATERLIKKDFFICQHMEVEEVE